MLPNFTAYVAREAVTFALLNPTAERVGDVRRHLMGLEPDAPATLHLDDTFPRDTVTLHLQAYPNRSPKQRRSGTCRSVAASDSAGRYTSTNVPLDQAG
ncbi:hypothetical protein [Actinacidiphila soli]|uniref:hypothetical protein n=1 Tax=Actinacidiphila soli TaxID=2487275 RepID=UPI000FCC7593|nr:hypothetical protein [Actinacidiphila soli]